MIRSKPKSASMILLLLGRGGPRTTDVGLLHALLGLDGERRDVSVSRAVLRLDFPLLGQPLQLLHRETGELSLAELLVVTGQFDRRRLLDGSRCLLCRCLRRRL